MLKATSSLEPKLRPSLEQDSEESNENLGKERDFVSVRINIKFLP